MWSKGRFISLNLFVSEEQIPSDLHICKHPKYFLHRRLSLLIFRSLCRRLFVQRRPSTVNCSTGRAVPLLWPTSCRWSLWIRPWSRSEKCLSFRSKPNIFCILWLRVKAHVREDVFYSDRLLVFSCTLTARHPVMSVCRHLT